MLQLLCVITQVWAVEKRMSSLHLNPSTQEADVSVSVSSRPAWSSRQVPCQPELCLKKNFFSHTQKKTQNGNMPATTSYKQYHVK